MSLAVDGVRLRGQRGAAHQRGTHGGPSELGRWPVAVVRGGALDGKQDDDGWFQGYLRWCGLR
jgi:hypothetical protein